MRDAGIIKTHGEEHILIYRMVDLTLISLGFILIVALYVGQWDNYYLLALTFAVLFYSAIAELLGVYNSTYYSSLKQTLIPIILSWVCSIGVLLCLAFAFKVTSHFSRVAISAWLIYVPAVLLFYRLVFGYLSNSIGSDSYKKKSIIIGATSAGLSLAKEIQSNKHLGIKLVGLFDDRSIERLPVFSNSIPIRGSIIDALHMAKERDFRHVYVALPMQASQRIKEIIDYFSDSTARVYIVPDFFTFDLIQSRWRNVGQVPTLSVHDTPFYGLTTLIKRIEDIVVSSIILTAISPILISVAIGVKLSSPGPIIFKQHRYGIDGKKIKVWKFRSMKVMDNGNVVKQATKDDPRVTKFGSFIRRTSLDELPQFINVLQGRMSIVGPRPHAIAHNEEYRAIVNKYMLRHKVKPGITGWAQINGYRGETDTLYKMEKRVEHDLTYIRNWSLWLDIKIIFLTVFKGFSGKNTY